MKMKRVMCGALATVCVGIGAMAGISASSAASSHAKAKKADSGTSPSQAPPGGRGGPQIHSVSVVVNKAGTGFDTVTEDSGTVQSVSGQSLTIVEGSKTLTYKTVTLTIPSAASIQRDGKSAELSELQAGDRVNVSEDSEGSDVVTALDSSFKPTRGAGGGGPGMGAGGPPGGSPGGPPPTGQEG
jgi:hypothetical protein